MQFILTLYPFDSLIQGNICDPTINSDTEQHLQLLLCVILGNFETTCYINPYLTGSILFYIFGHQFRIFVPKIDCKEGVVIPQASPFSRTGHSELTIISTFFSRKHEKWTRMTFPLLWKSKSNGSSILSPHCSIISSDFCLGSFPSVVPSKSSTATSSTNLEILKLSASPRF